MAAKAPGGENHEYGKLYPYAFAVLRPTFNLLWRVHTSGLENVPETGPAIFCPNHLSVIDSFFLPLVLPRQIFFVGKSEYMDSWKTKHVFPALGMIPIERGGGSAAERALDTAAKILDGGGFFGIYPEGTRSRTGNLHKGHTGPARLAMRTGAPIIPVGMKGTLRVQPPGAKAPRPFKSVEVNFGRPVRPEKYKDRGESDHLILRQMIDEVMYDIRELSGQDYENTYATKKAEQLPTEVAQVATLDLTNGSHDNGGDGEPKRRTAAEALADRAAAGQG
jgi:1-acyl-sn-glycerol-3-phosphate acyltransferase